MPNGTVQTATADDPVNDAPTAVTRTDGQQQNQSINSLGQQTSQSGAGQLAASFGYDNGNGVGQVGNITTYQGAVTNTNGVLTGSGAAMTSFGYDPATGLQTSKTYAGQTSPTDTTSYSSKFQISATTHGTVNGSNFVYNPAGELTGQTLLDTSTDATLASSTPVINQKGQPKVFSTSYVDPTNGLSLVKHCKRQAIGGDSPGN